MFTPAEIQAASLAFSTSTRSIYRWLKSGLQSLRPEDVAHHIASQRNPKSEALDKAEKHLSELLNQ
jgi:hypothetical protein